jgi:hypothetical protein
MKIPPFMQPKGVTELWHVFPNFTLMPGTKLNTETYNEKPTVQRFFLLKCDCITEQLVPDALGLLRH